MHDTPDAIAHFARQADAAMAHDPHAAFLGLREAFRRLAFDDGDIAEATNRELRKIAADPAYLSMGGWDPHNLILATGAHWQLRVGLYTRSSELLYSLPYHMMIAIVGAVPLTVDHYLLPYPVDKSVFEPGIALVSAGRRTYRPGEVFEVDSRRDVIDARVDTPVAALKLNSSIHAPQHWAFARGTGIAVQGIASDPLESDLVSIARALGAMGRDCAVESVTALSAHPSHFVRWAAVQSLARLAPEQAVETLRAFSAEDPHPHLRASAAQALRRLEPQPAH